jgi:Uma2 family endonuclease
MSRVSTIKMTARQFLELGEDPPGVRLELVDGEIAVSPSPIPEHSRVVIQLATILNTYIRQYRLGELLTDVDTIFGEHDVRRPDLLFFVNARRHLIAQKAIEGPPDLCIEVISQSSGRTDRKEKFELYASGKVKHYWIVDPRQRTIEAYRLRGGKYIGGVRGSGSDVVKLPPFPKLAIPLDQRWWPKGGFK